MAPHVTWNLIITFVMNHLAISTNNLFLFPSLQPILTADMRIIDLGDGEVRLGGSFRTTLSKGAAGK